MAPDRFQVQDIGVDAGASSFVEGVKADPSIDVVAVSAMLTYMSQVVDAFKEAGLYDEVKIIVGGAPTDPRVCNSNRRPRPRRGCGASGHAGEDAGGIT